jgi:hypothetical protein
MGHASGCGVGHGLFDADRPVRGLPSPPGALVLFAGGVRAAAGTELTPKVR